MSQQVVDYKGRHIQVSGGEQASQCLALVRKAIDMTAELGPKQRAQAAEIKDLRCNPRPSVNRTNDSRDNTVGVYTMKSLDDPSGYINFPIEAGAISAADMVISLVGNSSYARWHHAYLAARKKGPSDPAAKAEAERIAALFNGSDKSGRLKAECALLNDQYEVVKSLDLGEKRLRGVSKQLTNRGCG
jgi:hypothetical protein